MSVRARDCIVQPVIPHGADTLEDTFMCGINSTCSNAVVAVRPNGQVAGVLSWDGLHRTLSPCRKMTEDDVLAKALYLEKHGHQDEAVEVLELYLAGLNPFH